MNDRPTDEPVSPVVPTAGAAVRLRPLGLLRARVDGGLWANRRRVNREVTIPHGLRQLETAGNLGNFRLAARRGGEQYRAGLDDARFQFPFLDSDVYKWLEAVAWELAADGDAGLESSAGQVVELVAAAQRADGYLDTYYQVARPGDEFTDLQWGHELYTTGHLIQAAVAWRRGLGDDRLLKVAERAVARIDTELGPGRRELVDGHPEIEMALVELYRTTGKGRYLELAQTLLERRGHGLLGPGRFGAPYWQDHRGVREATEPAGHAVRQVYLDCGVVDVAVETGDRELLGAAIRRWEAMVASRTYLTGGLGSRHRDEAFGEPFELPPDRAYAETCAAIGSVMLAQRLLLATGESRFADLIERTAFNAVLPGLALDGSRFFYSNPLQRRSSAPEVTEGPATTRRSPWFACACCPPNLMRFLATMPDLLASVGDRAVHIHQFATGSIAAPLPGGTVRLEVRTAYPWDGDVEVVVREAPPEPWLLSLRVPAWCTGASVEMGDGEPRRQAAGTRSWELRRTWRAGDEVRLRLSMPPRMTLPDPRIDAVRGTVALERGPIVYAIEAADLPAGATVEAVEVEPRGGPPVVVPGDEQLLQGAPLLAFDALVREPAGSRSWPYQAARTAPAAPAQPGAAAVPAAAPAVPGPAVADGDEGEPRPVRLRAIPYFAWGNRAGVGMRVWLPVHDQERRESRDGPEPPSGVDRDSI